MNDLHPTPQGLSSDEVKRLLWQHGENVFTVTTSRSLWKLFFSQILNFFNLLLSIAAIISIAIGDYLEAFFIILITIINAGLGFWHEYKAEQAIAALQRLATTFVRTIRGGKVIEVDSKFLVPGDIIMIEEGMKVPADSFILEDHHLEVNEASLSGESFPVSKRASASGDEQLVFMGTFIIRGRATCRVVAIGMQTRFGSIARSLATITEEPTPLTRRLAILGKYLALLALTASAFIFTLGVRQGIEISEIFLTSLSLVVAAVPEGLPVIITLTLALGTQRMAQKKAIIRKLSAIETLGITSVICTDKTGTLTTNTMSVRRVWVNSKMHEIGSKSDSNLASTILMQIAVICNFAEITLQASERTPMALGDQTEGSLLLLAHQLGMSINELREEGEILEEFPFDPRIKRMSVIWKKGDRLRLLSKGAPESILSLATKISQDNRERLLTTEQRLTIEEKFSELAREGLRIVAFAYKDLESLSPERSEAEKDLVLTGFVGIADPPRPEVKAAIQNCKNAGIRVVMITGDNMLTARAIANDIGLLEQDDMIIDRQQLERMSAEEFERIIDKVRIFARITPEHKLRIVESYQRRGHITAVTGDGVNDALALKQADVGIAMGITGTDAAKEAADMIVSDDNFFSIANAIEEGRIIYDNILRTIHYLLSCNLAEILTLLGGLLLSGTTPLLPLQILWMNLVTDGLPALALSMNSHNPHVMTKKPKGFRDNLFSQETMLIVGLSSLVLAVYTLIAFFWGHRLGGLLLARTLAFDVLVFLQLVYAILLQRRRGLLSNRLLFIAIFITLIAQVAFHFLEPFKSLFQLAF